MTCRNCTLSIRLCLSCGHYMYNPQPSLFLSFPKFIYLCVWVFWLLVCLCTTCAPCASGGQRRQQIPWNCGYGQLWTNVWVLGIEPVLLATKPSVQLRFSFFHLSATHRRVYWDQGILSFAQGVLSECSCKWSCEARVLLGESGGSSLFCAPLPFSISPWLYSEHVALPCLCSGDTGLL